LVTGFVAKEVVVGTLLPGLRLGRRGRSREPTTFFEDVGKFSPASSVQRWTRSNTLPLIVGIDLFEAKRRKT
jgi:hypothetical protein